MEGPCEEAERREGGYEGIRTTGPPRSWVTDMTTGIPPSLFSTRVSHAIWYITFLRRFYMYTHHWRGWTFTQLCSYIPFHRRFLLHLVSFSSSAISLHLHSAIAVAHTHSLLSVLPPKPRALLQSESHNDFTSCPFLLPLDLAFVI